MVRSASGTAAGTRTRAGGCERCRPIGWSPSRARRSRTARSRSADGAIAAVGTSDELGDGEQYAEAVILPGFVNAHSHLEYAVYGGVRRRAASRLDRAARPAQGADRAGRQGGDRATGGRCGACSPESRRSGTAASSAPPRRPVPSSASVRSSTSRCSARRATRSRAVRATARRVAGVFSEQVRVGISPHAPYTCTVELYRGAAELGLPVATHLAESAAETRVSPHRHGRLGVVRRDLVSPLGDDRDPHARRGRPPRARASSQRTASRSTTRRSRCSRSTTSASRTAPARTACWAAESRHSPHSARPGSGSASRRTAPLPRRPSTCSTRCGPRSWLRGHASGRPDALTAADALELATLGGAKRSGSTARSGRSRPASAPT